MKLNRDQIIKALECVSGAFVKCAECAFRHERRLFSECRELAAKSALVLIKKLTVENAKLQKAKDDTLQEMRERLTTFFASDDTLNHIEVDAEYINSRIDLIAKEMEGI